MLNFYELQARLCWYLRALVRSGDWSGRSLAKAIGVSQPYLHLVLSGKRSMTPELGDLVLRYFRLSVLDLVEPAELAAHAAKQAEQVGAEEFSFDPGACAVADLSFSALRGLELPA